jgi:predicted nucleic acid-binding protein
LLLDTSAWVELFRKPSRLELDELGGLDEVVTCLPVVQEVLQGFRDEHAFRTAREAILALPTVDSPLPAARFEQAVDLCRAARRAGVTVRSSVDCLIAATALHHGLTVVHRDRDYPGIARVSSLSELDLLR